MARANAALTQKVTNDLRELLSADPDARRLNRALRHLAKWRYQLLDTTITQRSGDIVMGGPFAGMVYGGAASEGARVARLLGVYEASLVPVIESIVARKVPVILDVGCAEGYYAVGLARRMPDTVVHAHDINPKARALASELAKANGVSDRVLIGGEVGHADFDLCLRQETVVICDIEGAEETLLDPVAAPGLVQADILVEVHDAFTPGLTDRLAERFAATHKVTRIGRKLDASTLPDWAEELGDLDRLLLLWEWRGGPTPWLWLESKTRNAGKATRAPASGKSRT